MLHNWQKGVRAIHTSRSLGANKTVLYGWGQTSALPLTKGHIDGVFDKPTYLKNEHDYALPVSQSNALVYELVNTDTWFYYA
jgi:hypothetical protein